VSTTALSASFATGATVTVTFDVNDDLYGASPFIGGFLPQGRYTASGVLVQDPMGLRADWTNVWPVVVTSASGWLSARHAEDTRDAWDTVQGLPMSRIPPTMETRQFFVAPAFCTNVIMAASRRGLRVSAFESAIRMLLVSRGNAVEKCTLEEKDHRLRLTMSPSAFSALPAVFSPDGKPLCVLWGDRERQIDVSPQE